MTTQISILGLDLIGQSLGLALSAREFPVTGFAPRPEMAQEAQKRGAVRQVKWNISQDFRPGSTVVSVSPLLAAPLAWATEVLPADRNFMALHPLISPARPSE